MKVIKSILLAFIFMTMPVYASYAPVMAKTAPRTCKTVQECIMYYSEKYNVSASLLSKVIYCESGNNPKAIGDNNTSFGLSQIHIPAHPNVTIEQAFNIPFAVEFMAKEFSKGNQWMWTCYFIVN